MCAKYSHGVWERFAHTFENSDFQHVDTVFVCGYCVFKPLLSSMFGIKCYRQNDRTDHGMISRFP